MSQALVRDRVIPMSAKLKVLHRPHRLVLPELRTDDPDLRRMMALASNLDAEMAGQFVQYSEQAILNSIFGNCIGCVHTGIAAGTASQTTIAGGTFASAGVTGNWDTTPAATATVLTGLGGSGVTKNQYTNPHIFQATASAAASITIASQTMSTVLTVGDFCFTAGITAAPLPAAMVNTFYIGLGTGAIPGTASTANIQTLVNTEPTIGTGGYARIVVPNNALNWVAATSASPSVLTNLLAQAFAASSAGWSTGATNLVSMFILDAPTGTTIGTNLNCYAMGTLGTAQAVNAAGITLSFTASTGIQIQLT